MGLFDSFKKMSPMAKAVSVGAAIGGAAVLGPQLLAVGLGKVAAAAGAALLGAGAAKSQNRNPYNPGRASVANSVSQVPNYCQGEYRIMDQQNDHKYIGVVASENRNLQSRLREHHHTGMFDPENGDWVQCLCARNDATKEQIYKHEQDSIAKHNPYMNKCKGGNGPR